MLSKSEWLIIVFHVICNGLVEELWTEQSNWVNLSVLLISWVMIFQLFSSIWSPFLRSNEVVIEDFFGVNIDKFSISVISYSTSIVALSDKILDCFPWNWLLFVICFINNFTFFSSTKVVGNEILADTVVRLIEGVLDIPSKSSELLSFNDQSMEPGKTEDSLSE